MIDSLEGRYTLLDLRHHSVNETTSVPALARWHARSGIKRVGSRSAFELRLMNILIEDRVDKVMQVSDEECVGVIKDVRWLFSHSMRIVGAAGTIKLDEVAMTDKGLWPVPDGFKLVWVPRWAIQNRTIKELYGFDLMLVRKEGL